MTEISLQFYIAFVMAQLSYSFLFYLSYSFAGQPVLVTYFLKSHFWLTYTEKCFHNLPLFFT